MEIPKCALAVAAHPDDLLQPTLELRRKIVREIRRFQPDTVLCWDPSVLWINDSMVNHPDHRAAAQATVDAVFPSAGLIYLHEDFAREGLKPWKPDRLFIVNFDGGDTFMDIEETMDLKIAALKKHKSQIAVGVKGSKSTWEIVQTPPATKGGRERLPA